MGFQLKWDWWRDFILFIIVVVNNMLRFKYSECDQIAFRYPKPEIRDAVYVEDTIPFDSSSRSFGIIFCWGQCVPCHYYLYLYFVMRLKSSESFSIFSCPCRNISSKFGSFLSSYPLKNLLNLVPIWILRTVLPCTPFTCNFYGKERKKQDLQFIGNSGCQNM